MDPPTFIRISAGSPKPVQAGKTFTLRFETDAQPDYFSDHQTFIAAVSPPSFGTHTGLVNVIEGHGKCMFRVATEIETGSTATVTLEVRPPANPAIRGDIKVVVVDPPETGGPKEGKGRSPNINPIWVTSDEDFWKERGWDKGSVAAVIADNESVNVYVSAENRRLDQLIQRAQRRSTNVVDAIKEFYLEHLSFFAVIASLDAEQEQADNDEKGDEPGEIVQANMEIQYKSACDTICGIIESLFQYFIQGVIDPSE